jgi:hypothetical protein
MPTRFSLRVSVQRSARPVFLADQAAQLRVLGAVPDGQLAAFEGGRRRAALHRQAGDPLVDDVVLDDHVADVERGVVGGYRVGDRDVASGRGEQQGLVLDRGRGTDDRGQRLVVHAD